MKILIYDNLEEKFINSIRQNGENEVITLSKGAFEKGDKELEDADILIGWGDTRDFTEERIKKTKRLKWIHVLAAGVDRLPFEYIKGRNIKVTNSRGIHAIPISEYVFATLLFLTKSLNILYKQQMNKFWMEQPIEELSGKTMVIIGLGKIGKEIARKAKVFDMKVLGIKNNPTSVEYVDEVYSIDSLKEVLGQSQIVVVALPLTRETAGLFNLEVFKSMRKDAYFINIGRGKLVDEKALIQSLKEGIIKAASLDVFDKEPLPQNSPLWEMNNVIITPHQAGHSALYMERAIDIFINNLKRMANNERLVNLVDLDKQY
ncbi:phosphoglycerate dehydrogenase-like enzyme [Clostridium tetanomorphum]|uniref:D-2-hydroxyacid dehydrogenase n=1 Tax=Clostridium tetanomorphum TaxID=1553 RepID=A0A923EBM2_CLOTT|nr:D-2-hydroxyacid dehydrogenase [Clostridium tetanomorphum]KAJ53839.1 D-isomer specific 2-hydroxyacid dehydrogenase NAD-binding protein [Clostridium tetanomorphum DSM 665]MBC2397353.1 D-2-hydroxyacid dehydrogenase [Clostridium tetanomorphum]MBP1862573.1 phosphoglycerate dehydrogenase-like enzyme [Clostridium tetanomorphum]NRS85586.1 phosphoglycerate dehydrogenase-like enzyme [Clostridium tetanomorphum]NRZ96403.1 phosphoglycerate dehydrogenase-like enzyme [Clostridium tetanomorphum]